MNLVGLLAVFVILNVANVLIIAVLFLNMMIEEIRRQQLPGSQVPATRISFRNALVIFRSYRASVPGGKLHLQAVAGLLLGVVGNAMFVFILSKFMSG